MVDGGAGYLEVPALGRNHAEGKELMSPRLLMLNELVWRRHVLSRTLLFRVLHHCLNWEEVDLVPRENSHWSYPLWWPPLWYISCRRSHVWPGQDIRPLGGTSDVVSRLAC